MTERRFVIREIDGTELSDVIGSITESELSERLWAIGQMGDFYTYDKALPILLHGEGKEEPPNEWTPKQLAKHLKDHPDDTVVIDKPWPDPEDIIKMRGREGIPITRKHAIEISNQTLERAEEERKPAPTREEWEAWGDRVAAEIWPPMIFEGRDGDKKRASTKDALLSIPIVPRGK